VTVQALAGEVTITVADAGDGIGPDHLGHLFERFYKAGPARGQPGGSGLGLAIARENARLHGGDIVVEATGGPGAIFVARLPRYRQPPAVAQPLPGRDKAVTPPAHDEGVPSPRRSP
ncbi:MAG: ATP-binding protein, partial [Acidimicrobiales bacterium]